MHRRESALPTARLGWHLREGCRRLAFWLSIVLPAAYLPLLATGLPEGTSAVLAALLVANLGCLYLGHGHWP